MKLIKKITSYFTKFELILWISSLALILITFFAFNNKDYMKLSASLIGATALILNAKGNPLGQVLIIIFATLYSIISYACAYYGEMITYFGMSLPMAIIALVAWLKNPFEKGKSEVKVNTITKKEYLFMSVLTVLVTIAFYFILKALNTANLIFSTISVTTSFAACYLTFRRSPLYALFYALNDIVLIILWVMVAISDLSYLSVIICFIVFLINDLYGFFAWLKMEKRQKRLSNV